MNILLNGVRVDAAGDTLGELLATQAIDATQRYLAIAINDAVVPRAGRAQRILAEGDRIEVVQPMKGG